MSRFARKFIGSMMISAIILISILDVFIQFTFDAVRIDTEKSQLWKMIVVVFLSAAVFVFMALFLGRLFTRYFKGREYELSRGSEFGFFRNYVLFAAAVIAADMMYLYKQCKPFFEKEYLDAQMRIKINGFVDEVESAQLTELAKSYEAILDIIFYSVIAACIVEVIILLFSARFLVKSYQSQGSIMLTK